MDYESVALELGMVKAKLDQILRMQYLDGASKLEDEKYFLRRLIDRIYPSKAAESLKEGMDAHRMVLISRMQSPQEKQEEFVEDAQLVIRTVETIIRENDTFGFDDFQPIKEKKETEWQLGSDKFGYIRKKTSK